MSYNASNLDPSPAGRRSPGLLLIGLVAVLFGLAMVIFLIAAPRGLAHRWEIFKISWKIRPYAN